MGHPSPAALFCVALGIPIILSGLHFPVCEMRRKTALNPQGGREDPMSSEWREERPHVTVFRKLDWKTISPVLKSPTVH